MKYFFSFILSYNGSYHATFTFTNRNISKLLLESSFSNFHDRIPDESSRGIDKGYHRGNPLYRFLWNVQLVMPAFVCRGSSRILSPAIKPRYKSKGYECNDTSGTKGSSYLASRACTRVSRVCVYIGWFKKILHKMKDLYTEKKKYR